MVVKIIKRKKNPKIVKEGLINMLRESNIVEERKFNTHNVIDQQGAIYLIKNY